MEPLRVVAHLSGLGGPLSMPDGYIHLDALLAFAVCLRDEIPPALSSAELVPIEIPVAREPEGRFHLCSASISAWDQMERRYTQRRFPIDLAPVLTDMKRVNLAAGAQKNFRVPLEAGRVVGDMLTWFLVGDREGVRALLSLVSHLGKRRGVGLGKVARWDVEPCEPWGDGFPVVLDGKPLRHLPLDWPGLDAPGVREGNLSYPYWLRETETLIACPDERG